MKASEAIALLEEIKNDFVNAYDKDPLVKRICNTVIHEFKLRCGEPIKELKEQE